MKLYFVRHGESEANLTREFSNRNDETHPLTEKGKAQVAHLAEQLREVKFDAIYASPLLRARQTAELLNAGRGLPMQITPALREHDAGELEGRADKAAWEEYANLFKTWMRRNNLDARITGGESFTELRARFELLLEALVQKYGDSEANILLIAHGGIFHLILPNLLNNVDYSFSREHLLENAAVIIAEYKHEQLLCVSWAGVELNPQEVAREI